MRRRVLGEPAMRILFAGQAANMFGNSAMIIVLGIWVKDLTGSSGAAGLIFLLLAVSAFAAPLSGLVVDRFPRRRVLIANDLVTGVLVAALVFVHGRSQVWLIYLVAVGYGLSGQIYRAARGGLLHSIVPTELLGDANGLFSSLGQGLRIAGPLAGAAIYAGAGGGAVALVDVATFGVSAASYLLLGQVRDLRPARPAPAGPRGELLRELAAGARHVLAEPVIRRLVLASAVAFTGAGMLDVALFALVDKGLHRTAAIIGVLGAVQGAGSVVAGLVVGPLMRRTGEYATATAGFLLNGVGLALAATATTAGVVAGAALIGLGLPWILVAEITLLQRRTPAQLQGRALAASDAIVDIPFAAAIAVGAAIIEPVGFRPVYLAVAASFTAVGLALLPFRGITTPAATGGAQPVAGVTVAEPAADAVE